MCKTFKVILLFIVVAISRAIVYGSISAEEKPTLSGNVGNYRIFQWMRDQTPREVYRAPVFPFRVFGCIRWHTIVNCGTCIFDAPIDLWANDPEKRSHIIVYKLSKELVNRFWNFSYKNPNDGFKEPAEVEGLYAAAFVHHAGFMHDIVLARITFTIHVLESGDKIAIIKTITNPELVQSAFVQSTYGLKKLDAIYNAYALSCKCLVRWIETFAKEQECSILIMETVSADFGRCTRVDISNFCKELDFQKYTDLQVKYTPVIGVGYANNIWAKKL